MKNRLKCANLSLKSKEEGLYKRFLQALFEFSADWQ
jgi:hypothetical protein